MNVSEATAAVAAYISVDQPTFMWGPTGIGKSAIPAALAKEAGAVLIDWRAILHDTVDLQGLPVADILKGETKWLRPSDLPFEGSDLPSDRPIYLFLDELNTASPSMQAACFGLVLERRAGPHKLMSNVRIIAAGNRQSDRAAAQKMPSALANRFAHIDVDADPIAWRQWADTAGNIAPVLSSFIAFRPALIHKMEGQDLRAFPSPRAWESVGRLLGQPEAIRPLLIAGLVGTAAMGEFEAFLKVWNKLPPIADILKDPAGAAVPAMNEPALMFAVSGAISRHATRQNFGAVIQYAERLPQDFTVLVALDATRRDPSLVETQAFILWAANNSDVAI